MLNRNAWLIVVGLVLSGLLVGGGTALCQTAARAPADANAIRRALPDPNRVRRTHSQVMMDTLDVTEDQWKAMEPLVQEIKAFRMQLALMRAAGMTAAPAWMGSLGKADVPDSVKELIKASLELAKVLQGDDSGPDRIKLAMEDFRKARSSVQADLDKTQAELRRMLNLRQEAVFKQMGVLDLERPKE